MSRLAFSVCSVFSLVTSGCFLWHDNPDGSDAGSPWTTPPTIPDGALPPTVDASLPPIDEPDVDPDERPSDDPGAGDWTDPPPASGNPCCDVGEVVGLDDPTHVGGFPVVAWDSDAWGVVWADEPSPHVGSPFLDSSDAFVRLDADARRLTPARPIWGLGPPTALTFASGRYALASQRLDYTSILLGVLDRNGALVDVAPVESTITSLARFPLAHVWAATTTDPASPWVQLRAFDDALEPVGEPLDVGVGPSVPALVALKSRLVVFHGTTEGIAQTTVAGPELTRVSDGMVLETSDVPGWSVGLAATAMRDTAVLVALDGTHLWSVVYDPFLGEVVHGPTQVAASASQNSHGVAADPVGGTVGVCYPELQPMGRPRPYGQLQFALLDPEGAPIGAPVGIGSEEVQPSACAVASAGLDQYVVVLWNPFSGGDGTSHSIYAARVTVRR